METSARASGRFKLPPTGDRPIEMRPAMSLCAAASAPRCFSPRHSGAARWRGDRRKLRSRAHRTRRSSMPGRPGRSNPRQDGAGSREPTLQHRALRADESMCWRSLFAAASLCPPSLLEPLPGSRRGGTQVRPRVPVSIAPVRPVSSAHKVEVVSIVRSCGTRSRQSRSLSRRRCRPRKA